MKKKIIFGIGTLATIAIPVAATISCGNPTRTVTLEKAKKADGFILQFNPQGFANHIDLKPKKPWDSLSKKLFISMADSKANKVLEFTESLAMNQTAPANWKPQTVYVKIKKDLDSSATSTNLADYFYTPYTKKVNMVGTTKIVEDGYGNKTYTETPISGASIVSADVTATDENDFLDANGLVVRFGSKIPVATNAESISNILMTGGVKISQDDDRTMKGISDETLLGIKTYLDGSGYMINPKTNPTLEKGKIKTLDLIKKDSFDSVMMVKESLAKLSVKATSIPANSITSTPLTNLTLTGLGALTGFFPTELKGTTITYKIENSSTDSADLVATVTKERVSEMVTIKVTK